MVILHITMGYGDMKARSVTLVCRPPRMVTTSLSCSGQNGTRVFKTTLPGVIGRILRKKNEHSKFGLDHLIPND